MGSDEGADDERPSHKVLVDTFYASAHPITVEQYAEFTHETAHGAPGIRDLPMFVTATQEASFRELATPYIWRGGDPPRDRGRHQTIDLGVLAGLDLALGAAAKQPRLQLLGDTLQRLDLLGWLAGDVQVMGDLVLDTVQLCRDALFEIKTHGSGSPRRRPIQLTLKPSRSSLPKSPKRKPARPVRRDHAYNGNRSNVRTSRPLE